MKLFSLLQRKKSLAILGLLLFCQSASAGASFEELSITRVNATLPTKLYVHAILTGIDDTQKIMFKISNASGVKVSDTTLTVGASKKDLAGQTYISYETATEYTEGDSSKTFVLSADLLNSSGVSLLSKTTSFVPKNLVVGGSKVASTTKVAPTTSSSDGKTVEDTIYTYLAPLPGFGTTFDIGQKDAISNYLGILFKVILGLMGVVAVFELIRAGITMMSDSFSKKSNAKDRIKDIVIALIIGLCSVLILQTINPKLVNMSFGFSGIKITMDEKIRAELEKNTNPSKSNAYKMVGTFENPKGSTDKGMTANSLAGELAKGAQLKSLTVYPNKRGCFSYIQSGQTGSFCVDVNVGMNGFSEQGTGVEGDKKTPKGTHKISGNIQLPKKNVAAKTIGGRNVNLGAAFLGLSIDGKSTARGIGIHGDASNCIVNCKAYSYTEGCIKMSNDDLVLLAPYMTRDNINVIVK